MPQMAPMWWTSIMMMTMLTLIMLMTMIYFTSMKKLNFEKKTQKKMMNWKW